MNYMIVVYFYSIVDDKSIDFVPDIDAAFSTL